VISQPAAVRGVSVAGAVILIGALTGVVWSLVSPVAQVKVAADGAFYTNPEQFVGSDVWFTGLCAAAGLVAGLLAWFVPRGAGRGIPTVVGLAVGGGIGAYAAWVLGERLGHVDLAAAVAGRPVGTVVDSSLVLHARGLLVVLPVTALATWLVYDLLRDLRHRSPPVEQPRVEQPRVESDTVASDAEVPGGADVPAAAPPEADGTSPVG
jgi:drug/metabolite transporter (DMT)-like permease